ncbi:MAG TPA: alpha-L-fucosidase [Cellvibrionaceae bacterium]
MVACKIKTVYALVMKQIFTIILLVVSFSAFSQDKYESNWTSIDKRETPEWFVNAKFGIFVHWGLYSVPAWGPTDGSVYERYAEWYWKRLTEPDSSAGRKFIGFHNEIYSEKRKYQDFVSGFNAELFNPDQWADIFKDAGAKYVVLTSKHHEGFALWPSKHSWNWNSVDVGPHRDLAGDLSRAVKDKDMHMGFYYSLYEWFNPLYAADVDKYVDLYMLPQMKDLVTRYKPDIFWSDGEWDHSSDVWKSTQFLSWLYNESPVRDTVVVNDRWGSETRSRHGDFHTTEYDLIHDDEIVGDVNNHPWEETRGIGGSFGYNRNETLDDYESSEFLIHYLINKVSRGGNLLLNVGPTADGRIPVIQQQRLRDIGNWLRINGEAIYSTRAWQYAPAINKDTTAFFTTKNNDLFLHVTEWRNDSIIVENTQNPDSIRLLGLDKEVEFTFSNGRLVITPPVLTPSNNPSHYAWVYKISNAL